MGSTAKQILERAMARGLLTKDQATELARLRHRRKEETGLAPAVEDVAVERGYLTPEQAKDLRVAQEQFDVDRRIGGYELIEKIGSGTMGTVYRAMQLSLDRVVAIKVLSPHLAHKKDFADRFLREARAVAKLNHPNVISGIDVGEVGGVRYFVMEYASGVTVGQLLERGGAMDETRVARIAMQIARALDHAHEKGLVHRDVKPDNILLTKDGVAKLCDLGLAKDRPEAGVSMGTPHYVSPEQAKGDRDVDIRADLYSFGATLYHMLSGRTPFSGSAKVVMVKHLSEEPPALREVEPDVSETMAAIVHTLLRKDPKDRFDTPAHLIEALESCEEGRKRAAAAPATPVRAAKRRKRR
jgi:serine/threonine-protein kinase